MRAQIKGLSRAVKPGLYASLVLLTRLFWPILGALALSANAQSAQPLAAAVKLSEITSPADEKALATLVRVRRLIKAGAPNLALSELQLNQSAQLTLVNNTWKAWHEQKWSLFEQLQDYQGQLDDIRALPPVIAGQLETFIPPFEAQALIHLGEPKLAQRLLQTVINDPRASRADIKRARGFLIDLHSSLGDHFNAQIDASRFHSEFKPQDNSWFIKRALIEYQAGSTQQAIQILAPVNAIDAKLLQTYFRYSLGQLNLTEARGQIAKQQQRKRINPSQQKLAHGLLATLGLPNADIASLISKVSHLEQYHLLEAPDLYAQVVTFWADDLNQAYAQLSQALGNEADLLGSNHGQWFALAQRLEQQSEGLQAKALYSQVLQVRSNPVLSDAALNRFTQILLTEGKVALLKVLFNPVKPAFTGDLKGLDSSQSAMILNQALTAGDADLIALVAPYLGEAPPAVSDADWLLQKARIDIFSGRFDEGRQKLLQWTDSFSVLDGAQVDKALQPVFDLQSANEHQTSIVLFDAIANKTQSKRHRREILFWKAQSNNDMGERLRAAAMYLESALMENNGFDEWGQSARFHAASTLMEAAYYDDAKKLFEGLINATKDPARLTTIKQSMQRLWLLKNNIKDN